MASAEEAIDELSGDEMAVMGRRPIPEQLALLFKNSSYFIDISGATTWTLH